MTKISSNKILEKCEVIDIADKGKSVAKSKSGEIVFLENAVRGDIVDVLIKILKACRAGKIPAAKEFDERAYTLQNIYTNPTFANKVRVGRYSQKKTG